MSDQRTVRIYDIDTGNMHNIPLHQPLTSLDQVFLNEVSSHTFNTREDCPCGGGCLFCLTSAANTLTQLSEESVDVEARVNETHFDKRIETLKVEGDIGECGICLEAFKIGEEFKCLPCSNTVNHKFHVSCIDPWLKDNTTCPTCRAQVTEVTEGSGSERDDWAALILQLMQPSS